MEMILGPDIKGKREQEPLEAFVGLQQGRQVGSLTALSRLGASRIESLGPGEPSEAPLDHLGSVALAADPVVPHGGRARVHGGTNV